MDKIKVLVVEDSLLFRELLVESLNRDPNINVVGVARDAFEALEKIEKLNPDVMTLDIEMPRMSGLELLENIMPTHPVRTIVVSSLSDRVFESIRAGAVDFVVKPNMNEAGKVENFIRSELPTKVRIAAASTLKSKYPDMRKVRENGEKDKNREASGRSDKFRYDRKTIIAIGASTGGTEATAEVLKGFGSDLPGIVITQHMPAGFTAMYAKRLDQRAGLNLHVKEAQEGDIVQPGLALLAPAGDRHMKVKKINGEYQIVLEKFEKVNGHCPSVDVLFQSVAEAAGKNSIGIILTGMGGDGAKGLLAMRKAGAGTIGQNESSCVVYGMPRVAYALGAVEYQEDIKKVAERTYSILEKMQKK